MQDLSHLFSSDLLQNLIWIIEKDNYLKKLADRVILFFKSLRSTLTTHSAKTLPQVEGPILYEMDSLP